MIRRYEYEYLRTKSSTYVFVELAGYEHLKNYKVPEKFQKNIIRTFE